VGQVNKHQITPCQDWGTDISIRKVTPKSDKYRPQRKCVVCTKNGRKKTSVYCCEECDVGHCLEDCFEAYYTNIHKPKQDLTFRLLTFESAEQWCPKLWFPVLLWCGCGTIIRVKNCSFIGLLDFYVANYSQIFIQLLWIKYSALSSFFWQKIYKNPSILALSQAFRRGGVIQSYKI
jgi:hypothetical protein